MNAVDVIDVMASLRILLLVSIRWQCGGRVRYGGGRSCRRETGT